MFEYFFLPSIPTPHPQFREKLLSWLWIGKSEILHIVYKLLDIKGVMSASVSNKSWKDQLLFFVQDFCILCQTQRQDQKELPGL